MKIIEVVQRFHPALGGAETQVKLNTEELAGRGHEVIVLTTHSLSPLDIPTLLHPIRRNLNNLPTYEKMDGYEVYRYKTVLRFYGALLTTPMMMLLRKKVDIIHAYSFYVTTSVIAAIIAKLRDIPFVLTANDCTIGLHSPTIEKVCSSLYDKTLGKILGSISTKVIAVSNANRIDLIKAGVPKRKIVIIPNAVRTETFHNHKNITTVDNPTILYVGRISRDKGIQYLIKVVPQILKDFPAAKFVVVGQDYGYLDALIHLAEKLKVSQSLFFTGPLSDKELVEAYSSADLFVLPSELEAFGIVLIEAMSAGVPVIASNCGGMPCVVQDGVNGFLFNVGDVKDLTVKIKKVLSNKNLSKKLVENGRKTARKYMVGNVVEQLEKLYWEIKFEGREV